MALTMETDSSVEADTDSSSRKVVFHGDLTEFRHELRCESCSAGNLKCIIQRGEESCMFCNYGHRPCVFERKIQLQGSALRSHWDTLVALGSQFGVLNRSHFASQNVTPNTKVSPTWDVERARGPPVGQHLNQVKGASMSYGATGFEVPAPRSHSQTPPPRNGQRLPSFSRTFGLITNDKALRAAKVRKLGACQECRVKKVKCSHVLHNDHQGVYRVSPPIFRNSIECSTATDEDVANSPMSTSIEPASTSILPSEIPLTPRADAKSLESDTLLRRPRKLICPIANCGRDFRGEHELTRHCERVHRDQRVVWVCNDISEGKKALAGCRSCESGKQYNADYNAVQHLRRCHVVVKPHSSNTVDSPAADSTETKRLVEVPNDSMEELRKWLRKKWIRNENRQDPDNGIEEGTARLTARISVEEDGAAIRTTRINTEEDWENQLEESFGAPAQQDAEWQALPGNSYEPSHPQLIELH